MLFRSRSNGSDERMYADQWFDRCWFSFEPEQTFLRHLNEWGSIYSVDEVIEMWNDLQDLREEEELEECDEAWKAELSEELNGIFREYQESCRNPVDTTLESGMEKVLTWDKDKRAFLKGNAIEKSKER